MEKVQVVITRPMCVLGDNKATVRFEPSTKSNPFVEVSYQVYDRLKRAGAAKLYQQWLSQTVNEKPKPNEQEVSIPEPDEQEISVDISTQEVTQVVEEVEQAVDEKLELGKQEVSIQESHEQEVSTDGDTQDTEQTTEEIEQTSIKTDKQSPKAKTSKSSTRTTKKA
ncbi:hypothetical protein [Bartonella sp. WD16.2]|uniref:hypothetical protein n=1 Tax=Bartonella sp. WD16.2 TaxID=1933904 RepID=UPI00099AD819|nr:hypothetical protein [Bartonella sp. WD16.2]AQX20163.1 hypothetical protein BWD162_010630 [Bartonella sp. WD16.2]AQX20223.1 hypothetical protein BWD162_011250 [Bartonella sp. WD16.2]